jgi:hypothetical protein
MAVLTDRHTGPLTPPESGRRFKDPMRRRQQPLSADIVAKVRNYPAQIFLL